MDKSALTAKIRQLIGNYCPDAEIDGFWEKLQYLRRAGRYGGLLSRVKQTNDQNNFLALTLEATFAFQFESVGKELT